MEDVRVERWQTDIAAAMSSDCDADQFVGQDQGTSIVAGTNVVLGVKCAE